MQRSLGSVLGSDDVLARKPHGGKNRVDLTVSCLGSLEADERVYNSVL